MNKIRVLYVLVIICIAGNLFMAWKMTSHPKPPHRPEPREIIIEKLQFDDAQIKQYDLLIAEHRNSIHESEMELFEAKNKLYASLSGTLPSNSDSLLNEIAIIQQKIETTHYHHFRDIKNLCRAEQIPAYDALTQELAALFRPPHKAHPDRHP